MEYLHVLGTVVDSLVFTRTAYTYSLCMLVYTLCCILSVKHVYCGQPI